MHEEIQCLIDWLNSKPSDEKAHRILRALAKESLKKANLDIDEQKKRFTNKEIVAAVNEQIEDKKANKWVNWNKTVLPYWGFIKPKIIEHARKKGLRTYPEIDYYIPKKAGRGNESSYWIKSEPLPEHNENDEENRTISHINFQYELTENGEVKPSWLAEWMLHDGQIRLSSWHIWAIFGWLSILGGSTIVLSYIIWVGLITPKPVTTHEITAFISIFVLPYTAWVFFIKPWIRLFEDRIVEAPALLIAFEEKSAQLELFRDGDLRMIRLVSYTAPCPICGATVHLDKGEPDFPRRLVGRCSDSPREHIFSFDRVTQKGSTLRSPFTSTSS